MSQQRRRLPPPATVPPAPERGVKAATHRLLLDTAMALIQTTGQVPSIAEVAERSKVSRATAYRYFPSRGALTSSVIETSLGPVRILSPDNLDGRERVRQLFTHTFPRFREFEPQLRAAAQLALEQSALERAGQLEEEPYRRGHRVRILEHAIEPLRLPLAVRQRLHRALSVIYGIEPIIILKDIWKLDDDEVQRIAFWMADSLIDAALRDAAAAAAAEENPPPPAPAQAAEPRHRPPATVITMRPKTAPWYDSQYNARASIPGAAAILQSWQERSAHTRAHTRCVLDLPYSARGTIDSSDSSDNSDNSERLDLFLPRQPVAGGAPVLVHIHGGYWRALHKEDQSFVAEPFAEAGALVVVPNYALCPQVSVAHIVLQMVQALAWTWRHARQYGGNPHHIVVSGHSAGGHLAAMMLACRWPEHAADLPAQLVHTAVAVSGLFDLEPLRHAPFLASDLGLTEAEARRLSPAAMPAPAAGRLLAFVGEQESSEFHRQAQLIGRAWGPAVVGPVLQVPGCHHMSVLDALANPGTALHQAVRQALGLGSGPASATPSAAQSAAQPAAQRT